MFAELTAAIERHRAEKDAAEQRWLEVAEMAEALDSAISPAIELSPGLYGAMLIVRSSAMAIAGRSSRPSRAASLRRQ